METDTGGPMKDKDAEDRELAEARAALERRDERPFARWCASTRPQLADAGRKIWRRWQLGPAPEAVLEDMLNAARMAAYRAVLGYRYICPRCTRDDKRYGAVRSWGADTFLELEAHMVVAHPGAKVRPHVAISRRVWYMAGVAMQGLARREATQFHRTRPLPDEEDAAPSIAQLRDMEAVLDARRTYAALPPPQRALVGCLHMGMSVERALDLCQLTQEEVLTVAV